MKENNIIDLSQRRTKSQDSRLKDLKLRIDLEQAKVLVTTSLVSVLFLVTLANNSIMSPEVASDEGQATLSSRGPASAGDRAIASVPTGTSDWEDEMVRRLGKLSLDETSKIGRKPSSLERLTLEYLEGKYAVRFEKSGKIRELAFSNGETAETPKHIVDRAAFLAENRELLPVQFSKSVKAGSEQAGEETIETYELLGEKDAPVANVRFRLDAEGRMLSMKVSVPSLASF